MDGHPFAQMRNQRQTLLSVGFPKVSGSSTALITGLPQLAYGFCQLSGQQESTYEQPRPTGLSVIRARMLSSGLAAEQNEERAATPTIPIRFAAIVRGR